MDRIALASLIVLLGCAGIDAQQDGNSALNIPPRSFGQTAPPYEYKIMAAADVYDSIKHEPAIRGLGRTQVFEKSISRFGKDGWRFSHCYAKFAACDYLIFERSPGTSALPYEYKLVPAVAVYLMIEHDPAFQGLERTQAIEAGISRFGKEGWRFTGCYDKFAPCDHLIFERPL